MLKIRLQRVGRKHDPSFRIVLTDSKNGPKSGKFIEILGNYDAKKDVKVADGEKIKYWISQGAKVSDTVHNILVDLKIFEGKKINVLPKKSPVIDEEKLKAEAEAKEKEQEKDEEEEKAKAKEKDKATDVSVSDSEAVQEDKKEETKETLEKEEAEADHDNNHSDGTIAE